MRFRALLLLGLALVFGGLAAFMVNRIVTDTPSQVDTAPTAPGTSVVAAAREISRGETLTEDMLRLVQLPQSAIPENAFSNIADALADPPVLAMDHISEREVLLPHRLSTGIRSRGITGRIPEGKRAIAIAVNAVRGVSGFVLPGTRVDILHTTSIGRLDERPVTRTLLQDVTILSINQDASDIRDEPLVASVANLLVDPDQAKTLILAQEVGSLSLALRSDLDDEVIDRELVSTITLRDLWVLTPEEQAAAAEAARQRAEERAREEARRPVGIIRGLDVSEQIIDPNEDSPAAADRSN